MIGCLALYDFDVTQFKIKEWVAYGEEWMAKNGYPPNTIGFSPQTKYVLFNNGKQRLEKEGYERETISFNGGGEPKTSYNWMLMAYFSIDHRTTYLCFDEDTIPFSYGVLEQLLVDLCQLCSPKYGIGFMRDEKHGPDAYAIGFSQGLKLAYENPEHGKERERISKWLDVYRGKEGYQTGDLRDIYPFNVLSQAHLNRLINGHRFQDWVQASTERGQLKQISETVSTWWVEPENIPYVREVLAPSGMILCL
ncbi:MAG: hypothetical protein FJX03_07890 [Alphaproteobacteria bacterium]|nr:hypothetical protein [Alphaproteobacteria bacterium]